MKKIQSLFSSVFAFIYLFLSVGIGLEAHYCHGNLASISVTLAETSCECDDGEEMSCCSTEEAVIQLDEVLLSQQKINSSTSNLHVKSVIEDFGLNEDPSSLLFGNQYIPKDGHFPPIFLLNSSFLFYG